jgi:DNA-binding PadR family transcriptional regulator
MITANSRDVGRAVLNRDAMVYPAVRDLIDGGYLDCQHEVVEGEQQHVCRLSEKGKEAYVATERAWERMR